MVSVPWWEVLGTLVLPPPVPFSRFLKGPTLHKYWGHEDTIWAFQVTISAKNDKLLTEARAGVLGQTQNKERHR